MTARAIATSSDDEVRRLEAIVSELDTRAAVQAITEQTKLNAGTHRLDAVKHWCDWNGDLENPVVEVWRDENGAPVISDYRVWQLPKAERPRCGAKCRDGHQCRARGVVREDGSFKKRCRMHGGLSTGPKTTEGRAAIGASNRRRGFGSS